jgi:hypothetical protein
MRAGWCGVWGLPAAPLRPYVPISNYRSNKTAFRPWSTWTRRSLPSPPRSEVLDSHIIYYLSRVSLRQVNFGRRIKGEIRSKGVGHIDDSGISVSFVKTVVFQKLLNRPKTQMRDWVSHLAVSPIFGELTSELLAPLRAPHAAHSALAERAHS